MPVQNASNKYTQPKIIKFSSLLLICLLLAIKPILARELVFSHSNHPITYSIYIPLLQKVYAEQGISLRFQEAEGARAIKLLAEGVIDGDVARLEPISRGIANIKNVILLDTISVVLYCQPNILCDKKILDDKKQRVLVPTQDATLQLLTKDITAKLYYNNDWQNIVAMFNAGKIDYLLWVESSLIKPLQLNHVTKTDTNIGPFGLYHLLHSKNKELIPVVAARLNVLLNETRDK